MTAAPQQPSTAVTERKDREDVIGSLPESVRQQIALRKMMNAVAQEIAGMSWGQSIGKDTARALAEWGRQHNVDVTQEIDILGARVYLNAKYYLRRLGEMIADGLVEYAYPDHINSDDRLLAMGERGKAEAERRAFERVKRNVPEKAVGAVVFRVKMRSMTEETVGTNWAGGGTRTKDPVGDAEPVKTAESRAARRCVRQLASHMPRLAAEVERTLGALPVLEERIQRDHASIEPARAITPGVQDASEGYGEE